MRSNVVGALVREEWMRVRRWYPWFVLLLVIFLGTLYAVDAWARWALPATEWGSDSGLDRLIRYSDRQQFIILLLMLLMGLPFILGLLSTALLAVTTQAGQGVALALPRRYVTLPVPLGWVVAVQLLTRCVLTLPLTGLQLASLWIFANIDEVTMWFWGIIPILACTGAQAMTLWWTRMERMAPVLGVLVPFSLVVTLWEFSPLVLLLALCAAVTLPLFGTVLGVWQLRRFGPLEGQDFSLNDWLRAQLLPRADHAVVPARIKPFRSPAAAIRWAERTGSLWWPVGFALAAGFVVTALDFRQRLDVLATVPWQPWTPGWVKGCSAAQCFGVYWLDNTGKALYPATLASMLLFGLGMLRRNVLRLPLAARLPVSPWHFGLHTAVAGLLPLLWLMLLMVLVMIASTAYVALPNVGLSYVAPTLGAESVSNLGWEGFAYGFGAETLYSYFGGALMAWLAYFPLGFILLSLCAWAPVDLALLGALCWKVLADTRHRLRAWHLIVAGVFACCLALVLLAMADLKYFDWLTFTTSYDWADAAWRDEPWRAVASLLRFSLGAAAFFLLPVVCLWANIRLRSRC